MEYCSDFRYDLKVGNVKEEELAKIFSSKKISGFKRYVSKYRCC